MTTSNDSFNFCQSVPPQNFFTVIQSMNQMAELQYTELFENVFNLIENSDLAGEVDTLLKSCSDKIDLDLETIKSILRVLLIVCKEARRNKLTPGQLYSDMLKFQLESSRASSFCQSYKKNILLPKDAKNVIATKRLIDIDWKFGVTASSNSLARVGNCYLQLKMLVAKGSNTESILMEMSIPQFYEFMHEMEKAKIDLDSKS